MSVVKVGLIQMAMDEDPLANLDKACRMVAETARAGGQILCLPEMFNTRYFCRTQDTRFFDLAEPVPGPSVQALSKVAAEHQVVLVVPTFERRAPGVYHNTAAVIDADGSFLGKYRKMHIPQDPGFEEKFYFTPGDLGYHAWKTRYGCIGVCICWDQWYPEAARLTAMAGAEILFYPTAIGWLPEEKPTLGEAQHTAWETVQRGHGVANGCYVAAVNRVGTEGETEFWGQSFASDFYGQVLDRASSSGEEFRIVDCDLRALEDFRRIWPFFRDRRIDSYADITRRLRDE